MTGSDRVGRSDVPVCRPTNEAAAMGSVGQDEGGPLATTVTKGPGTAVERVVISRSGTRLRAGNESRFPRSRSRGYATLSRANFISTAI